MNAVANKIAVVTGAARKRGIGFATARRLASEGAAVVISDIPSLERQLGENAATLRAEDRRALALTCDVTVEEDVDHLIAATLEAFGAVDILVNNAGILYTRLVVDTTEAEWDRTCDVIGKGTFFCSRAAVRSMIARGRGGRIINIASISGKRGGPYVGAYAFAKFGVIGFTQALAREVACHGILVNAVCPGAVDTDLNQEFEREFTSHQGAGQIAGTIASRHGIPLGRYATADEIAAVVVFLASDDAGYITGQSINVDGGVVTH